MTKAFNKGEFTAVENLDDIAETFVSPQQSDPEINLSQKEQFERIAECLEQISERQQLIIQYKYVEELSFDEIGKKLGINANAVYQLHYQAIANLRKKVLLVKP